MRSLALLVLLLPFATVPASAQTGRDALRVGADASDQAEFGDAIRWISIGLDPAAGPTDTLWVNSLHRLTEALLEEGEEDAARLWARWAFRVSPSLDIDSDNFPPNVSELLDRARAAVQQQSGNERRGRRSWGFPGAPSDATTGTLRVRQLGADITAEIEGVGVIAADQQRELPVGTYFVSAAAPGRLPVTGYPLEVLPGVTTIIDFRLETSTAGFLYIASRPWGDVYIDGERVGYTALSRHRVSIGIHSLRIVREGFAPFDTTITVTADQVLRLGTVQLGRE